MMQGQLAAVRVALFQTSKTDAVQLRVEETDGDTDRRCFLSDTADKVVVRQSDYRGTLLLPIVESVTTYDDMLRALEVRLTRYCVLHVKPSAVDARQRALLCRVEPTSAADAALYEGGVRRCVCPHAGLVQSTTRRQSMSPTCDKENGAGNKAALAAARLRPQIRVRSLALCASQGGSVAALPTSDTLLPITPAQLAQYVCPDALYYCIFALTLRPAAVECTRATDCDTPSLAAAREASVGVHAVTSCVCVKAGERVMRLVARAGERAATGLLRRLRERRRLRVTHLVDDRTGACVLPCENMATIAHLAPTLRADTAAATTCAEQDPVAAPRGHASRMHQRTMRSDGARQRQRRGDYGRVAKDGVKDRVADARDAQGAGQVTEVRYYGAYEHLNHTASHAAGTLISMPELGSSDELSHDSVRDSSRAYAASVRHGDGDEDVILADDEDGVRCGTPTSQAQGNYVASLSSVGLGQSASSSSTSKARTMSSSRRSKSGTASQSEVGEGDRSAAKAATISPYLPSYNIRGACFTYSLYRAASQRITHTSDGDETPPGTVALPDCAHHRGNKRARDATATLVASLSPVPSRLALDAIECDARDAGPSPPAIRAACTPHACTPRATSPRVDGATDHETRLSPLMVVTQQTLPDYIIDSSVSPDEDDDDDVAADDDGDDGFISPTLR